MGKKIESLHQEWNGKIGLANLEEKRDLLTVYSVTKVTEMINRDDMFTQVTITDIQITASN